MKSNIHSRYTRITAVIMLVCAMMMTTYCVGTCFAKDEITDKGFSHNESNEELKVVTLTRKYEAIQNVLVDEAIETEETTSGEATDIEDNAVKNQILMKISTTFTKPSSIDDVKNIFESYLINSQQSQVELNSGDVYVEPTSGDVGIVENEVIISEESGESVEELIEIVEEGENIIIPEGVPTNFIDAIDVTATAYCLCQKCCGKSPSSPGYGRTASGLVIIPGTGMKVIAVDPKLIKLGTKVYVEGLNGNPSYGYAVAGDTGGAIKNRKIDLYFDSHADCIKWGRRPVRVYILPD